eukprot:g15032.t1
MLATDLGTIALQGHVYLPDAAQAIVVAYREKPENSWVLSRGLKGKALLTNPREARSPPCLGWQVVQEDGSKEDDPGGFMHKQVGIATEAQVAPPPPNPAPSASTASRRAQGGGGKPRAGLDLEGSMAYLWRSKKALECLDLSQLRGHITCSDPCVAEYFGHFVVLAHLEHLADLLSIKKRRERSSAEQLVRWGFALSGLRVLSTFGRREVGNRQGRILPGWEDMGSEMAALQLPGGAAELERMRIRRWNLISYAMTFWQNLNEFMLDLTCWRRRLRGLKTRGRIPSLVILPLRSLMNLLKVTTHRCRQRPDQLGSVPFSESAWTYPVVIGLVKAGIVEALFAVLLLLVNVFVQMGFMLIILTPDFLPGDISEQIDYAQQWRRSVAHDHQNLDLASTSLVTRVCNGDGALIVSTRQATLLEHINSYLGLNVAAFEPEFFQPGVLLSVLCILLWSLCVYKDCFSKRICDPFSESTSYPLLMETEQDILMDEWTE